MAGAEMTLLFLLHISSHNPHPQKWIILTLCS